MTIDELKGILREEKATMESTANGRYMNDLESGAYNELIRIIEIIEDGE